MPVFLRDGSANFTCCHAEIESADPTLYLTQSQYTDTGPTSPSADPITPGAWQGSVTLQALSSTPASPHSCFAWSYKALAMLVDCMWSFGWWRLVRAEGRRMPDLKVGGADNG